MTSKELVIRIGPQGRVVIPAELRRELEVEPGDSLVARIVGDSLVLRSRRSVQDELWAIIAAGNGGGMADESIAERREEARREDREHE